MSPSVITLELNELDFELVRKYAASGELPTFAKLLAGHDLVETTAEAEYSHLEPWIQWVTAHTGLTFAEHHVFRLGDIVNHQLPQLWEILEKRHSLRVGAISPMNASNVLENPAFFLPDPWTRTRVTGTWDLKLLAEAVVQAVNDNSHGRITLGSYLRLAAGAAVNVQLANLARYGELAVSSRTKKWRKALILDLLLSDAFIRHCRVSNPDYASLFLNAGAHIQHHYMFSSQHYDGPLENPRWYLEAGVDPVADAYRTYDRILENVLRAFPRTRLLLCTGLSQTPNDRMIHYYRPRHHAELLRTLGIGGFTEVQPRMSRDFLIVFEDARGADAAARVLSGYRAPDGGPIFSVENRGNTLFCMLCYTGEIDEQFEITGNGRTIARFSSLISHVSIENAIHRTIGYFLDTGVAKTGARDPMPLAQVFARTLSIWGEQ